MNKSHKYGLAIIALILMFSMYWYGVILYFLPNIMSLKFFAVIMAVISLLYIVTYTFKNFFVLQKSFLCNIAVMLVIIICYGVVTPKLYGNIEVSESFRGDFLALAGQSFPALLIGYLLGKSTEKQESFENMSFLAGLIFAFVSFVCTMNPSGVTSGGLAETSNNLNYQTLSYMAAYSSSFLLYCILADNRGGSTRNSELFTKFISLFVVLLNLITILVSGGRGGMVVYAVLMVIALILHNKKIDDKINRIIRAFLGVIVASICIIVVFSFASHLNISTSGFTRIIGFFKGAGDSIRSRLLHDSLNSFLRSPIIGHGFGSSFYEIGFYSHNFVTDLLMETGIVGTIIVLVILLKSVLYAYKLAKNNCSDSLWLFLLIGTILHYSFSGYYLVAFEPILIVSMLIVKKNNSDLYETIISNI